MKKILVTAILLFSCIACIFAGGDSEPEPEEIIYSSWMSCLDGELAMKEISIPGSHDSTTIYCRPLNVIPIFNKTEFYRAQDKTIEQQLKMGIRMFDIRYYTVEDAADFLMVHQLDECLENWLCGHGDQTGFSSYFANGYCYKSEYIPTSSSDPYMDGEHLIHLTEVLDTFVSFVLNNPDEVLILAIKHECPGYERVEEFSSDNKSQLIFQYLQNKFTAALGESEGLTRTRNYDPEMQLKNVRGCILLATDSYLGTEMGGSYNDTVDMKVDNLKKAFSKKEQAADNPDGNFISTNIAMKMSCVNDPHNECKFSIGSKNIFQDVWQDICDAYEITVKVLEICADSLEKPLSLSIEEQEVKVYRQLLRNYDFKKGVSYGIVMMDLVRGDVVSRIIDTNFDGKKNTKER